MTDGAGDARLDFVFIKAHMGGETQDALAVVDSSLSRFTHSVLLFCPVSDVSTLTRVFYRCALPCGLSGRLVIEVTVTSHLSEISHITQTQRIPLTTRTFICFLISLRCLHLQFLSISCRLHAATAGPHYSVRPTFDLA